MRHQFIGVGVFLGLAILVALAGGRRRVLCATETDAIGSLKADFLEHSRAVTVGREKTGAVPARLTARAAEKGAAQAAGLKIVVIEGEDAVNIIQQRSAVAPVIEVRDRNGQPVAGAVVTFAIRGGRATFDGARTLTMTTNVAGRAAVSGLTPTASGAVQISASAVFQGQTAAVTIAQTNVLTAAQAASVAGASGTGGGAGGGAASGASGGSAGGGTAAAAGGGGIGLSATTIGLVGAAVGGGAIAATQLGGDRAGGGTSQTTFEIGQQFPQECANLNNVRPGSTITFQVGVGRWPTPAEKEIALAGQYAVISLDDLPLSVFYEGTTWHDGGGLPGGYGDRARANWVATSGTHTVTALWTNQRQASGCTFTISK